MRLVVQDANIIIDLIECDLFELFFRLDVEVLTTSLVLREITQTRQKKACDVAVRKNALTVVGINTLEYLRLQSLDLPGLSFTDRSVLELADTRCACLLTGDGKLRKTAKTYEVEVFGILWVFDQLVSRRLLRQEDARSKLERLHQRNPRLPQKEIERRLSAWSE